MPEPGIGSNEDLETVSLRCIEQLAIAQRRPPVLVRGRYLMLRKQLPQWKWCALVEENAHSNDRSSTTCGVLQDRTHLLDRDAGKPFHKIADRSAIFEILEQGRDWNPRPAKDPGTAHAVHVALHSGACTPIDHGQDASNPVLWRLTPAV